MREGWKWSRGTDDKGVVSHEVKDNVFGEEHRQMRAPQTSTQGLPGISYRKDDWMKMVTVRRIAGWTDIACCLSIITSS
jgi:hypothetical protein